MDEHVKPDHLVDEADRLEAASQRRLLLLDLRRGGAVRADSFLCDWLEEIPAGDVPGADAHWTEINTWLQAHAFKNMVARISKTFKFVFSEELVDKEDLR